MDLSIIIVNWKSTGFVKKCIASILGESMGFEFEIIVIDAASYDGCGNMIEYEYPSVRFIQGERNGGFAWANNTAFNAAKGRCLLFLNPDTEVGGRAIERVYREVEKTPKGGAFGARLLNSDLTVQMSCVQRFPGILNQAVDSEILRRWLPWLRLWGAAALRSKRGGARQVDGISGAFLMVRREVFEAAGGFDEGYFMYAEDIDLCREIVRAGFTNYYVPEAVVIHHGGGCTDRAPSGFSAVMMRKSLWRYFLKQRGGGYAGLYRLSMVVVALGRLSALSLVLGLRGRNESGANGSWNKWKAILKWGLAGCDKVEKEKSGNKGSKNNAGTGIEETSCCDFAGNR